MTGFGKTLRAAREAKGLTVNQVADMTHVLIQVIEGLEKEDFSRIVAPIYGRGFVKFYCEAVGLDPKPFIAAFMELYNGSAGASVEPPPEPARIANEPPKAAAIPVPEPVASEPPQQQDLNFSGIRMAGGASAPKPPRTAQPPRANEEPPAPSRYAAPLPIDETPAFALPAINWRLVALAAAAAAVLFVVALGVRALYRASMGTTGEPEQPVDVKVEPPAKAPAGTAAPAVFPAGRVPLKPKPFYLDSDHSTEKERK